MKVRAEDVGALPGVDDIVSQLDFETVNSSVVSKAAQAIQEANIPLPTTMGLWDNLTSLIEWSKRKRLVRELPQVTVSLPWLDCHVPHSGKAQVRVQATHGNDCTVGLEIFGSGYSQGRSQKLTVTEESDPRSSCVTYLVVLNVVPKVYAFHGKESIVTEILSKAGTRTITHEKCPYCNKAPESLDVFESILDDFIDLRQDEVRRIKKIQLDWSGKQNIEIGAKLPGYDVGFSVSAGISSEAKWEIVYEIQPGYFYQPYRRLSGPRFQPPMWAFKK